ncbi:MAG: transglutaminase domain-containing protein, partial [Fervidobacterium sp.]
MKLTKFRIGEGELENPSALYSAVSKALNEVYYGTIFISNQNIILEDMMINGKVFTPPSKNPVASVVSVLSSVNYDPDHIVSADYPQSADITYHRLAGDCEDFARLASVVLACHGIPSEMIVMFRKTENGELAGHAVCYSNIDGISYIFDVHSYTKASSLQEALLVYYPKYIIFFRYKFEPSANVKERIKTVSDFMVTPI